MPARYVIGIDLGTTNSVLAYAPLDADKAEPAVLPAPQLVAAGTVESRSTLPSFLYLGTEAEAASFGLPWAKSQSFAVGEAARKRGAEAPDRTVVGAKSWLAYSLVDRRQPILPWSAPADVKKISPVEASRRYLEHLAAAWSDAFPDAPLAEQVVVLTVPASFDAAARDLTREAAAGAGFPDEFVLLEEPQAAVYAWLAASGERWRRELGVGDLLLVCDVGGGTSDFTLVAAAEEDGELTLNRVAVGNHLLVGGDNMDLALAHHVAGLFAEKKVKLDPWQSVSLWHSCRQAKETLLAPDGPETTQVSVLGRGSKLVGGTVSVEVSREHVRSLLLDGFLPDCGLDARPTNRRASGFADVGLPYEADPAITKHLAAFLTRHGGEAGPARPTHVLFNGGVFESPELSRRLLEVVSGWFEGVERDESSVGGRKGRRNQHSAIDDQPSSLDSRLAALDSPDLAHAVARGAAYYGWSKRKGGVRIRGGTARSYYVGVETAGLAIPGAPRPLRAVCVVPFGMEEGTGAEVPGGEVGLIVGEPAGFRFFSSNVRKEDRPGNVLSVWTDDELAETDSLEATLDAGDADAGAYVPVRFHSRITELGVMELWCHATRDDRKWKLEFSIREDAPQV